MDHRYAYLRPETGIRTSSEADIGHLLDSWKQLLAINTGIRPKTGRGTGYREISGPNSAFLGRFRSNKLRLVQDLGLSLLCLSCVTKKP